MRFAINILVLLVVLTTSPIFGWGPEYAYTTDARFPTTAEKTWLTTQPGTVGVPSADATWASTQTTHVGLIPADASAVVTCPPAVAALQGVTSQQSVTISTHFQITSQNAADVTSITSALETERTTATLVFSAGESVIVTNTASNCAVTPTAAAGSQALPADSVTTGTVLDIDLWCLIRSKASAPGTLTAGLNFSGAPICTGQFTPGNGWTDRPMHLSYQVTVQAAGAGGYVIGYGDAAVAGVVTIAAAPTSYSTVAIDFSSEINVVPAFQWQTADVDNSVIVQQFSIKRAR